MKTEETRKELENMPFDAKIYLADGTSEMAHATGFEVLCEDGIWRNEYLGSDGELYY